MCSSFQQGEIQDLERRVSSICARHRQLVDRMSAIQSRVLLITDFLTSISPHIQQRMLSELSLQSIIMLTLSAPIPHASTSGQQPLSLKAEQKLRVMHSQLIAQRILSCCSIETSAPQPLARMCVSGTPTTTTTTDADDSARLHSATADDVGGNVLFAVRVEPSAVAKCFGKDLSASSVEMLLGLLHTLVRPLASLHHRAITEEVPEKANMAHPPQAGADAFCLASFLTDTLRPFAASMCFLNEAAIRFPALFIKPAAGGPLPNHIGSLLADCLLATEALRGLVVVLGCSPRPSLHTRFHLRSSERRDPFSPLRPPRKKARGDQQQPCLSSPVDDDDESGRADSAMTPSSQSGGVTSTVRAAASPPSSVRMSPQSDDASPLTQLQKDLSSILHIAHIVCDRVGSLQHL